MLQPRPGISGVDRLVNAAILPDATKAAIRRAIAKRRSIDSSASLAASQDDIDHFESTEITLRVGEIEALVCIGVGKPSGLFRRRVETYWIFIGQRDGEHFFPISSHETSAKAADMLVAIRSELTP